MKNSKKKLKRIIQRTVDAGMIILLPLLMAEIRIGQKLHEWLGAGMLILFIVHHILNTGWWKSFFKGRFTPSRCFSVTLGLLLLLDILALGVSGVMMSGFVFFFLPIRGGMMTARLLHLLASQWGLILMAAHLGLHLGQIMGAAPKLFRLSEKSTVRTWVLRSVTLALSLYGIYALTTLHIPEYLFLQTHFVMFDETKPAAVYFSEIIAMIVLFAALAHSINKLLTKAGKRANRENAKGTGWKAAAFAIPALVCLLVVLRLNDLL